MKRLGNALIFHYGLFDDMGVCAAGVGGGAGEQLTADRTHPFHLFGDDTREIHQNGTEADRQKEGRLHLLFDGQIDKDTADDPHNHQLPAIGRKEFQNRTKQT